MTAREIYFKVHHSGAERVLAACDREILGKKFSQGQLKLEVNPLFYQGALTDLEVLRGEMSRATIINLAGNRVVDFAIANDFLNEKNTLTISGIKHAQIVSL